MKSLRGFSLLELMIALSLGLILSIVVVQLFAHYRHAHELQEALADIQENARVADHVLRTNLQHAGFVGCLRLSKDFHANDELPDDYHITPDSFATVHHYERGVWRPIIAEDLYYKVKPKEGTDVLVVRAMSSVTGVADANKFTTKSMTVINGPKFEVGDLVVISDCSNAEIRKIISAGNYKNHRQNISWKSPIKTSLFDKKTTEIGELNAMAFFIHPAARKDQFDQPIDALFMRNKNSKKSAEIVANVVDMSAVRLDKIAVIKLLLRSPNKVLSQAVRYTFNKHEYFDRYLYREVSIIAALRANMIN